MRLTVFGSGSVVTVETSDARVTWVGTLVGNAGQAAWTLPRTSPACIADVLDPDGGTLVRLNADAGPTWWGVTEVPRIGPERIEVLARPLAVVLARRLVSAARSFHGVTAGAIVRAALEDAVQGTLFRIGSIVEAPPVMPSYQFTGQSLGEVLSNLSDFTGQRWALRDDGAVDWLPGEAGTYCPLPLVEGVTVVEAQPSAPPDLPVSEVVARGADGRTVRWRNGAVPWGRQVAVQVDGAAGLDAGDLARFARQTLLRSSPSDRWSCRIRRERTAWPTAPTPPGVTTRSGWGRMRWGRDPWGGLPSSVASSGTGWPPDLREGDRVTVMVPGRLAGPAAVSARIIGHTYEDQSAWITLDLQTVPTDGSGQLPAWRSEQFTPTPRPTPLERLTPGTGEQLPAAIVGATSAAVVAAGVVVTRYGGPLPSWTPLPDRNEWVR